MVTIGPWFFLFTKEIKFRKDEQKKKWAPQSIASHIVIHRSFLSATSHHCPYIINILEWEALTHGIKHTQLLSTIIIMVKYCILDGSLSVRYAFIRYCMFVTEEGQANQIEIEEIKYISSIIYSTDLSLVSNIKTQIFFSECRIQFER
jgi:hypothetical protein